MGAGASADASSKLTAASEADVKSFMAELPADSKKKLLDALAKSSDTKPEWKDCFVIYGQYSCKDMPRMTEASLKDAAIQVKEEPRAPRFSVLGLPTNEPPPEDAKDKIFWLAEFECMDAWAGPEHKERETNKEYMQHVMGSGMSSDEGMPGMVKDMNGSYTGPALHMERPSAVSGSHDQFACLMKIKAKDADSVEKIVEALKLHGLARLAAEDGAMDLTVMCPKNMQGPLPKDDLMVYWLGRWKSKEDFAKHKETKHVTDLFAQLKELGSDDQMLTYEFAETKHFQK